MNKNQLLSKSFLFLGIGLIVSLSACKKDDAPKPVADFSFDVTDMVVSFTNASTDASTYLWDFGDGSTSTDENPTHTYADFGSYTVTLTSKGSGGTNTVTYDVTVASSEPIIVDGSFDDWTDVPDYYSYPDGEGATMLEAKVTNSDGFLYFYLKGTSDLGEILQLYIDADNNGTTGWDYWSYYETPGVEYLMEAVIQAFTDTDPSSSLQSATGPDSDWPWEPMIATNAIFASSDYVTVGSNKVIEFSMARELFTTPVLGSTIRIVFGNSDNTWSQVGTLPPASADPLIVPAGYTMK